jgi:FkbM family methyltransferase
MTLKARIYGFTEAITPPLLFRLFKGSLLYRLVVRLIRALVPRAQTSVETISTGVLTGSKLRLDTTGSWQQDMLRDSYDAELFSALSSLDVAGVTVYDIGAHVGYHSLKFAALTGTNGHVYAFEPNPTNNLRIKEHLELNPTLAQRITLCPYALSNTIGETTFISSADVDGGTSSGGFINNASTLWVKNDYIEKTGFTSSTVKEDTIDNLVATKVILPPFLIKIDVEGAEQLVLAGAHQTLTVHRPYILVEFHSIFSAYDCMRQLTELRYQTTLLKREGDGRVMIFAYP